MFPIPLTVTGTFAQTATGVLTIELGRHSVGEWDTLAVSGAAILGGTLDVRTLPSFAAPSGAQFRIMTFSSRTGTFPTVTLNGGPLMGLTVTYNATNVTLTTTGATAVEPFAYTPATAELAGRSTGSGAVFELALPRECHVRVSVFDVTGREVALLRNGRESAGHHTYELGSGSALVASGVYFGRAILTGNDAPEIRTARVTIVR